MSTPEQLPQVTEEELALIRMEVAANKGQLPCLIKPKQEEQEHTES